MSNILIFTASTGGGHNQAASSLEEILTGYGYEVLILDALKETHQLLNFIIVDGYKILAKNLPKTYGELYKFSNRKRINGKVTYIFKRLIKKKIYELIKKHNPKLIIVTHPFIINIIGELKEKQKLKLPFISVVTDFNAHQTYINKNVDFYITGSNYTKNNLIQKGIPEQKIATCGIPIRNEFYINKLSNYKKGYTFTILLMAGSLGLKAIEKVLKNLNKCRNKLRIFVVCGNNNSLKKKLNNLNFVETNKEIVIFGFTQEIPKLMDLSDVIISKPGGLTTSEAIVKKLPMIIPFLIPGQEEDNAEFMINSNMAIKVKNINSINIIIDDLINNPTKLLIMKENMNKLSKNYSKKAIIDIIEKAIKKVFEASL